MLGTPLRTHFLTRGFAKVTTLAINPKYKLLAAGDKLGEVCIYEFVKDPTGIHYLPQFSRKLSQSPWGVTPLVTGGVSALAWTEDALALAGKAG
jgi:hypothetical protein